jgi:hypothetical protein
VLNTTEDKQSIIYLLHYLISQNTLPRLLQPAVEPGLAAVDGPVERAVALWVACRDVGDGAPGGLNDVGNCLVEVGAAVAKLRGSDASQAVAQEAGGAQAAEAVGVADGGMCVLVLACNVCEARAVALPGGAARLVPAVVVVVLLQPVQGTGPCDRVWKGRLMLRVYSLRVVVVPSPLLLNVCQPSAHVRSRQRCASAVASALQSNAAQRKRALRADAEAKTVASDVKLVNSQCCQL